MLCFEVLEGVSPVPLAHHAFSVPQFALTERTLHNTTGIPGSAISEAGSWFVEGLVEECDEPGEYFYDAAGKALYYTFNETKAPSGEEDFSLTVAKVIFNISGTQEAPVRCDHALSYARVFA